QFYEFTTQGNNIPRIISSSDPVMVAQFSTGRDTDNIQDADPFLMLLNPNEQVVNEITFDAFDIAGISDYLVNVLALTDEIPTLRLDGAPVDPTQFDPIPGTDYSYGRLSVTPGSHTIAGADDGLGFTVYVYGYGNAKSFGYSAGGSLRPVMDLGEDRQFCAADDGGTFTLDAGEFSSYLWSTGETTRTIVVDQPGTYSVIGTNEFGCTANDEIELILNQTPDVQIEVNGELVPDDTARICGLENIVVFNAINDEHGDDFTYTWSSGQLTGAFTTSVLTDSSQFIVTVVNPQNRPDCNDVGRDTVIIVFYPDPVAEIQRSDGSTPTTEVLFFCRNEGEQSLTANLNNPDYFFYDWEDEARDLVSIDPDFFPDTEIDSTTYYLIVSNPLTQNDCEQFDTIGVVFLPEVEIDYNGEPAADTVYLCENATAEELSVSFPEGGEDLSLAFVWRILETDQVISEAETAELPEGFVSGSVQVELSFFHTEAGPLGCENRDTITFVFISRESASIVYEGQTPDSLAFCAYDLPLTLTYTTSVSEREIRWQQLNPTGNLVSIPNVIDELDTIAVGDFVGEKEVVLVFRELLSPAQCLAYDTLKIVSFPTPITGLRDTVFVCDSVGTIALGASGDAFTFAWQFPDGSTGDERLFTPPLQGTYTVLVTNTETGCLNRDTTYAAFELKPDIGIFYDSLSRICYNDRVTLFAVPDSSQIDFLTYRWGNNQRTESIFVSDTGTVRYTLLGTNTRTGCQSTVSRQVRFNSYPRLNLPPNLSFCAEGDTLGLFLSDRSDVRYVWSGPQFPESVERRLVKVNQAGIYRVDAQNTETGCSATAQLEVVVNQPPLLRLPERITACAADTGVTLVAADLTHGRFITYRWQSLTNGDSVGSTGRFYSDTSGVFAVTVTDTITGCFIRDTAQIVIADNPSFTIQGHETAVCADRDTLFLQRTNVAGMRIRWEGPGLPANANGLEVVVRQTGIYRATVTDPRTGCQTTQTQFVRLNPPPSLPIHDLPQDRLRLCPQANTVLDAFHPAHTPTTRYRWFGSDSLITDSVRWVVLAPNPLPTTPQNYRLQIKDTLTGCTREQPFAIEFLPQSNARITASDTLICLSQSVQLQAEGGQSYRWSTGETSPQITITPTRTGRYTYTLEATLGDACPPTRDTLTVQVRGVASVGLGGDTLRACLGDSIFVDGAAISDPIGTQYRWQNLADGQTISGQAALWLRQSQTLVLTKTDPDAACPASDTLVVDFAAPALAQILPTPEEICLGESLPLTARGGDQILWDDGQSTPSITWQPEGIGLQRRIVRVQNRACPRPSYDTAWVRTLTKPTINILPDVASLRLCAGDSAQLTPTGNATTYTWNSDPALSDTLIIKPLASTWVFLRGSVGDGGCASTDSVWIEVVPAPENYPTHYEVCEGEPLRIGQVLPLEGVRYNWTSLALQTPTIQVARSGTYPIQISIGDCQYSYAVRADFRPYPQLRLLLDTLLCFDSAAQLSGRLLNPDPEATRYGFLWQDESGNVLSADSLLNVPGPGSYRFSVAAQYAKTRCATTSSVSVGAYCRPEIFFPNAFTPNGDGRNERFALFGGNFVRNFRMMIYDRWGRVIYALEHSGSPNTLDQDWWDGSYPNGQPVPNGAYLWTIEYEENLPEQEGPQRRRLSGMVQVLR
ncbi:MAG: gliding motility-associated C-terminal domain-containing protein, partial [Bernardetiaceae bacterium]